MVRIYLITNKINGKQYVGKTVHTIQYRFNQHCNKPINTYIHNAINKYGRENFTIEELCRCADTEWQDLEKFYIQKYHTLYTEGGYNITPGGDSNPMDDPIVRAKHKARMSDPEMIKLTSKPFIDFNKSPARKELDKRTSERQKGIYNSQFKEYNNSKKIRVGMLDENGKLLKEFDSLSEALRYLNKPTKEAGNMLRYVDTYNKNGKRSKVYGYYWTKL